MKRLLAVVFLFLPFVSGAEGSLSRAPVVGIPQNGRVPILVRGIEEDRVRISFREEGSQKIQSTDWSPLKKSADYSTTLWLEGIKAKTPHQYRVEFGHSPPGEWISLKGFQEEERPGKFRFVFSSCFREKFKPHHVFEAIQKESPDFVALLGDSIYADSDGDLNKKKEREGSPLEAFRGKYQRNLDGHFQNLFRGIPVAAIWDDHDYGMNNGDRNYHFKVVSRSVFKETFPRYPFVEPQQGLYYQFRISDVDFFALDTRWYRSSIFEKDGGRKTMLGKRQLKWLLKALKESEEHGIPLKVIFSSVSWNDFGGDRPRDRPEAIDSWAGYKKERQKILDFIKENSIRGVLVLSGDQHWPSVDLIQGADQISPISRSKNGAVYSLKDHSGTVFEVSASPLNTSQSSRPPSVRPEEPLLESAVSLFRPPWWGDPPAQIPGHLKRTVSIYGLAEVDTTGLNKKVNVILKEMDRVTQRVAKLFEIEIRL
ncbi:MAG: alkaline phosphatase family protein [Deltaproteobacteria bacterium]|nr:alkaline phosphatase family protein [Deltaproteobacteria bacterium]